MTKLRIVVGALLAVGVVVACTHNRTDSTMPGPALGESTASGPRDSAAPVAPSNPVIEVNGSLRHAPGGQPSELPTAGETPAPEAPPEEPGVFSPPPDAGS
jgi:hypothetical protein